MKFYDELYKMKNIVRRGWILKDIGDINSGRKESDAEHIFSMLLFAWKIMEEEKLKLNQEKVFKLIMSHEIGEIDAGDITIDDGVSLSDKFNKELVGVTRVAETYNMPKIKKYWIEFEENKTPEAKFVKAIDKLDALMQCKIYSKMNNRPEVYEEFYNNAKAAIKGYEKYLED